MKSKKASLIGQIIVHLILIGLIFILFITALIGRANSDNIKQQILEKQLALLIASSMPNTQLIVHRGNMNGLITKIEVKQGRIFVHVNNLQISNGYPFFTKYNVYVESDEEKFYIKIKE